MSRLRAETSDDPVGTTQGADQRRADQAPSTRRLELVVLAAVVLVAAGLYGTVSLLSRPGPLADLTHYKYWAWLVTVHGLHAAYSGTYPETYAIYPPVTLLPYRLAGEAYRAAIDPTFALERALQSHALTVLLRLAALGFHLLVGMLVFGVARRLATFRTALVALAAYLFNPGVVFDVAQWGQPDPIFGLFVAGALAAVAWPLTDAAPPGFVGLPSRRVLISMALGGAAIALAALAKPQAWVYLPLIGLLVLRRGGLVGALAAAAAGGAAGLLVALPYLLHGTLRELLGLPHAITSVMPNVSANAHNLWWLVTQGAARWYLDQEIVVAPLSYRLVAFGLVGACAGLALLRAWREPTLGGVFVAGAYTALAFFMGMTQIHENHMYVVFPLLAVAAAQDRRLWPLYGVLALTWCANMALHDFDLAEQYVAPLLPWPLEQAQWINALVNSVVFALWTLWLLADTIHSWLRPRLRAARLPAATQP